MIWRESAAPVIAKVLRETVGDESTIKKALRDAYPFGMRQYYPYKIWLDEIARQRHKKPPLGTFGPRAKKEQVADPHQETLWPTQP